MRTRILAALALAALITGLVVSAPITASAKDNLIKRAVKGQLRAPIIKVANKVGASATSASSKRAPFFSAGMLNSAQQALDHNDSRSGAGSPPVSPSSLGCGQRNPDGNVRVNQDCGFRRQAEEVIAVNPIDPKNLIAGQNDSRIGFNHCGIDYSFDSGRTWGDQLPPFSERLNQNPAGHTVLGGPPALRTYDVASDPGVAFDSQGRAFFSCVVFDVGDPANGILVASSPAGAGGSFYNNVPSGLPGSDGVPVTDYVVVEDINPSVVHDKPFIAADSFASSPFKDYVYITWTVFNFSCVANTNPYCSGAIYFSRSTDHAVTWSKPTEISGKAQGLCYFGNYFDPKQSPDACNFDQGSEPVVRPNGDLVVIFTNGNTAADNPNAQQLAVVSKNGGATWSAPVKVGNDIVAGEPGCDFGRGAEECIPGAYIRTNDFPRIAVNRGNGNLYATWQDYRTRQFDIHLASSTDGGTTWTEAQAPVNPDAGKDHYFPAIAVVTGKSEQGDGESGSGDRVGVSYYRTDRVANENSAPGFVFVPAEGNGLQAKSSDYSLAGGQGLSTRYAAVRVSPAFPPPDGLQVGFNGDYSGLVLIGTTAHPIWSDTRNAAPLGQGVKRDEDVFTDSIALPGGSGRGS